MRGGKCSQWEQSEALESECISRTSECRPVGSGVHVMGGTENHRGLGCDIVCVTSFHICFWGHPRCWDKYHSWPCSVPSGKWTGADKLHPWPVAHKGLCYGSCFPLRIYTVRESFLVFFDFVYNSQRVVRIAAFGDSGKFIPYSCLYIMVQLWERKSWKILLGWQIQQIKVQAAQLNLNLR